LFFAREVPLTDDAKADSSKPVEAAPTKSKGRQGFASMNPDQALAIRALAHAALRARGGVDDPAFRARAAEMGRKSGETRRRKRDEARQK